MKARIRAGADGTVWVAGQVPIDPASGTKDLVGGDDVKAQTKQALKNLLAVLAMAGATAAGVNKTNIFVTDMAHYAAVNEVYKTVFVKDPPARACVAVKALPMGALVEIEAKAVRKLRHPVGGSMVVEVVVDHGSKTRMTSSAPQKSPTARDRRPGETRRPPGLGCLITRGDQVIRREHGPDPIHGVPQGRWR